MTEDDEPKTCLTLGRGTRVVAAAIRDGAVIRDEHVGPTGQLKWGGFLVERERDRLRAAGYRYIRSARQWRPPPAGGRRAKGWKISGGG